MRLTKDIQVVFFLSFYPKHSNKFFVTEYIMTFLLIWCFYSMWLFFFFILIKSLKMSFFSPLMSCIFSEILNKSLHVCSLYELVNIPLQAIWLWWPFFFQWLSTTGLYHWWSVTSWCQMTVLMSILKTVISLWKTWLLFQWDIHFKNLDLKWPPPSAYCLWYRQLIIGY